MSVVDNAIYVDGVRAIEPASLSSTCEELRAGDPGRSFGWMGLLEPDEAFCLPEHRIVTVGSHVEF